MDIRLRWKGQGGLEMKTVLKWLLRGVAAVVGLVVLIAAFLWIQSARKMRRTFTADVVPVAIPTDAHALAEGQRLATVYCSHCHKDDYAGGPFVEGALATIDSANLTGAAGSVTADYEPLDWVRTVRYGIRRDGRSLLVMPSASFWHLSDADLGAMVAYFESLQPVERAVRPRKLNPLGVGLVGAGLLDAEFPATTIDPVSSRPPAVEKTASIAFGDYMVTSFGCYHCHGKDFAGMQPPDPRMPFAPNLTQGGNLRTWNEEFFLQSVRSRAGNDMPWASMRAMTDDELRAIWRYLASLPATKTPVTT